jgi:ABC-type Mn2+/Zn2+ transport system ATPase subunit
VTGARPVEARGLAVGYDGREVLAGVALALDAGRSVALVGVNGSGKSTLLRTLAGLLAPVRGEVRVFGAPVGTTPERLAYLGQFHAGGGVLPLRVRDVVTMARYRRRGLLGRLTRDDREAVDDALERVDLGELAAAPLHALSGGQRQRVYLAHALARRADLLLLDEPTAGLDAAATERYARNVRAELDRGAAAVIATHDVRDAARADHVLLLAGRVVAAGAPHEVLTPERLAEAFGIELLAVPHGDHTDLVATERPHAHGHGGHGHGH